MIHVASLIHDDVLDEAEVRRGGLAVHKLYSNKVRFQESAACSAACVTVLPLANLQVPDHACCLARDFSGSWGGLAWRWCALPVAQSGRDLRAPCVSALESVVPTGSCKNAAVVVSCTLYRTELRGALVLHATERSIEYTIPIGTWIKDKRHTQNSEERVTYLPRPRRSPPPKRA